MSQFIEPFSDADLEKASGGQPQVRPTRSLLWIGVVLWLAVIGATMIRITHYSFTPGPTGSASGSWPNGSQICRDASQPTLLLFVHPRCPCTRATIRELARLAANSEGRFTAQVWFMKPAEVAEDWTQTDLWRSASVIPGVSVHADESGQEAQRFHALTSGQAMLYDQDGQLLFQGGITISRGHSGDNPGRTALEELLLGHTAQIHRTPVFGCSLFTAGPQKDEVLCKQ